MMRLFIVNSLMVGLLLFSATTASAINLYMGAPSATSLNIGDTFTIQFRMDTEGETQITSVFASVITDENVLAFVSGTSPGTILFNFSTYVGLAKASDPVNGVPGDDAGRVRAASFVTANPAGSGVSGPPAGTLLATLTFQAVGAGVTDVSPLLVLGDDEMTIAQISVTGSVTTTPGATITVVPEPGTALLMGLGLAGLGIAGRRNA
jgi:hypothetical protein